MERQKAKAVLESVLFTMGESVEVDRLASVIEEDKKVTRDILLEMKAEYDDRECGVTLLELDHSFQMCTKGEMYEYLVKIAKTPRKYVLTDTLLETLSIVAYKQPITRLEIEKIRGGELRSCGKSAGGVRAYHGGGKDGCAGGGESGYGFEECVGYSYGSGAQHEGEQSEQRQHYPDGGREQVAVAFSHVCVFGARCVCGQKSCQKCDSRGDGECLPVCFVVYQACGHGKQKEGGFYAQQPSDDALDHW